MKLKWKNFKILFFVFISILNCSFGQSFYFETTEGKKINVEPTSVKLGIDYDHFLYREKGMTKNQEMAIKNIKTAFVDEFVLNTFAIGKKRVTCFVIAESKSKKLVGNYKVVAIQKGEANPMFRETDLNKKTTTINPNNLVDGNYFDKNASNRGRNLKVITTYYFYVLDNDNNVVDEMKFDDQFYKNSTEDRNKAEVILRKHFQDCPDLIGRLNENDVKMMNMDNASKVAKKAAERIDNANAKVFRLFDYPKYINCNEVSATSSANPVKETPQNLEELLKPLNGTYQIGAITAQLGPTKKDLALIGVFSISDGFLLIETKDNKVKYPITSYKDGVIYCADRDMVHTMTIVSESGKKKGFSYTTKITVTSDKKVGGATADYWCIKN